MKVDEGSSDTVTPMSEEAFTVFYRAHLPEVYGYRLRLCAGDRAQAEDLTQDVWCALVDKVRLGHTQCADVRWLITVARSRFIDHARRRQRGLSKLSLMAARNADHLDDPNEGEVVARLAELPPLYRCVLVLRYVDGLAVPEIAELIGRGLGPTNSLLARARSTLRRLERSEGNRSEVTR